MFSVSTIRHGAPFVVYVSELNKLCSGTAAASKIAESILEVNNSVKIINFVSCHSANGGCFSNAQMLANVTGKRVKGYYGATNPVKGKLPIGRTFHPQNKVSASICSIGNRLFSYPMKLWLGSANW